MNTTSDKTIVVTGTGCILPGCDSLDAFWQRLLAGESAIGSYDNSYINTSLIRYFGHISSAQNANANEVVPYKLRRYSSACSQWGTKAASDAVAHANLDLKQMPDDRCGLFTAQGDYTHTSLQSFAHGVSSAHEKQSIDLATLTSEFIYHRGMDPFTSIKSLSNNLLAIASLTFETRGDCGAFVHDDNAVVAALRSALFSLRHGYCDVALLICAGSYNEVLTLAELYKLEYLSACDGGPQSLRPFDLRRDGTIAGEGAIAFVLETAAHAQRRQAVPLAKIGGVGSLIETPERSHRTDAYQRCTTQALAHTGIDMSDVGAIVASGKGGYMHDQREASMLSALQADRATRPITCATPITGNLPACPTEWLTAIGMLQHNKVPPIAHLEQPLDKHLQLVQEAPMQHSSQHVLALNAGFIGSHSAVLFSHPHA